MPKHGSINLYVHGSQKARKDGQPRTATSTLTQLLNYGDIFILLFVFLWHIVVKSLIKGDNFGDPKCFREERRVVEESTLLTTAVQPPPVRMILLFSARSIGRTQTTEEHSACVKIRSECRGSCVICGQRSTDLPCEKRTSRLLTRQKGTF